MKKLTKKSLDELAKTMTVIPESEREGYWGMYDRDCFWRCVAYLNGKGSSEAAAEVYANQFFSEFYGASGMAQLSSSRNAEVTIPQMNQFLSKYPVGRTLLGFSPSVLNNYAGFSGSDNHIVICEGQNTNGSYNMRCPQTNTCFTISESDYKKALYNSSKP